MWIAIITSVAVISFFLGVVLTLVYLVYIAEDLEEGNTRFTETLSKGGKIE